MYSTIAAPISGDPALPLRRRTGLSAADERDAIYAIRELERVRSGAFWLVAVLVGSVTWITDAAWGWHYDGWMVKLLGYHDAYASGVVHAVAGGAALAA